MWLKTLKSIFFGLHQINRKIKNFEKEILKTEPFNKEFLFLVPKFINLV